jgi:CRISPR type IV-associated protein Csf1
MLTTPQLFAKAHNHRLVIGDNHCFFCGGFCENNSVRPYLKDTFTNWRNVLYPSSEWICDGCPLVLNEKADLGKEKLQKVRNYSWILTSTQAVFTTKNRAGIQLLRDNCLKPPDPPFAICLAVSGQKHLLYNTPVNRDSSKIKVQLETEQVTYTPDELSNRISLFDKLIHLVGRKSLCSKPIPGQVIRVYEAYPDEVLIQEWDRVYGQPLSRLAAFLTTTEKPDAD